MPLYAYSAAIYIKYTVITVHTYIPLLLPCRERAFITSLHPVYRRMQVTTRSPVASVYYDIKLLSYRSYYVDVTTWLLILLILIILCSNIVTRINSHNINSRVFPKLCARVLIRHAHYQLCSHLKYKPNLQIYTIQKLQ